MRTTNTGNVFSNNVCAITGICASSGSQNWNNCFYWPPIQFWTGNVAPGNTVTFYVNNYYVPCNAWIQTQYIKAEINYSSGCWDNCVGGNYDQHPISITP